jgi:hypothetical protein
MVECVGNCGRKGEPNGLGNEYIWVRDYDHTERVFLCPHCDCLGYPNGLAHLILAEDYPIKIFNNPVFDDELKKLLTPS